MDELPFEISETAGPNATDAGIATAQRRLADVIARATSVAEVAPEALAAIGECLGWSLAAWWMIEADDRLACADIWQAPGVHAPEFAAATWQMRFGPGVGLPGIARMTRRPVWVADLARDGRMPRRRAAAHDGLHVALALPVCQGVGDERRVCAVIEFLGDRPLAPSPELIEAMDALVVHVGSCLELLHLRSELRELRATEIEEEVVDGIGVAISALETGNVHRAHALLEEVGDAAQRIADSAAGHDEPPLRRQPLGDY